MGATRMLALRTNRTSVRTKAGGTMTQVIEKDSELIADSSTIHSVVLRFTYKAIALHGEPVRRAVLEWYADAATRENLSSSELKAAYDEFVTVLGRSPRRIVLLSTLRDLVAVGYLRQSIDGFSTTDRGQEVVSAQEK